MRRVDHETIMDTVSWCTSCNTMDWILSVQNKKFPGDGKEFTKVSRAVAEAKSHLYGQSIGVWQILWRIIMESQNVHSSSIKDKRNCLEGRTSAVLLQSGLDEKWWARVQDLLAEEKTPYQKRFEEPFKGPIYHSGQWLSLTSDISTGSIKTSSTWQESLTGNISRICVDRGENLERKHSDCGHRRVEELARIRNLPSKNARKRGIDHTKGRIIHISSGRWYNKIVRKRQRIPRTHSKADTNRMEWRSQWRNSRRIRRVSTDRTKRWRRSTQRLTVDDFILPRVETFAVPLKYIDVTRCRHTNLDVMQAKRIEDYWIVDENWNLSDSWSGFTKFTLLKEKSPQWFLRSKERLTKCGQKYGPK